MNRGCFPITTFDRLFVFPGSAYTTDSFVRHAAYKLTAFLLLFSILIERYDVYIVILTLVSFISISKLTRVVLQAMSSQESSGDDARRDIEGLKRWEEKLLRWLGALEEVA